MAPSDFDAQFLRGLEGTKVTTFYDIDRPQEPSATSPTTSGIPTSVESLPADSPPGISPPPASHTLGSPTPVSHTAISHSTSQPATASTATAPSLSLPSLSPPPRSCSSWIITQKLYEQAVYLTKENFDNRVGVPLTAGLFLCHLEEDPAQIAFMRIYYQIPVTGTADNLAKLAQQVIEPKVCSERGAFKQLMAEDCTAVPRYFGYDEKKQGPHDHVPGGYIEYLVWEKVPGESLTEELFWSLDRPTRDDIRAKFRAAFEEILGCGVEPYPPRISKIIYDQSTGNVRISGFRQAWPIDNELEWSDDLYVLYGLAKPPKEQLDWYDHPDDWTK